MLAAYELWKTNFNLTFVSWEKIEATYNISAGRSNFVSEWEK
jgi:hypothetical protein